MRTHIIYIYIYYIHTNTILYVLTDRPAVVKKNLLFSFVFIVARKTWIPLMYLRVYNTTV